MKRFIIALAACAILPAAMAAEATLKGKFTIDGKDVALKHALVLDFDDAEGMGDGPELRILFSDAPVAQSELESPILFNLDALAREGKLQGVLLRFDPKAESREVYGTTYATPSNPQTSMPFFTLGGDAGGVDSLKVADGALSGSVSGSDDGDVDFGTPAYTFDITFTAPITKATPVKVLQGKEAMATDQMKTYLKFEEAMGKGDLDTIRKMTTPEKSKQMDEFIEQMGKEAFIEMAKQMVSDPATREKALKGLYMRGDNTTIVFDDENGMMSVNLKKKGDVWIMD
jgi:hypothetical protein